MITTTLIFAAAAGLIALAVGMAIQDKAGIEQFVWKAGSDIVLDGAQIAPEDALAIERILMKSAKGTERGTGNKRVEHEFVYRDPSIISSIEAEEGNLHNLEIWQLGSSAADETIPSCSVNIMSEQFLTDPEAEETSHVMLKIYRTWNA